MVEFPLRTDNAERWKNIWAQQEILCVHDRLAVRVGAEIGLSSPFD